LTNRVDEGDLETAREATERAMIARKETQIGDKIEGADLFLQPPRALEADLPLETLPSNYPNVDVSVHQLPQDALDKIEEKVPSQQ